MIRKAFIERMAFLAILFSFVIVFPAYAERLLVKKNDVQVVIEDEINWCKDNKAFLSFRTDDQSLFFGDRVELQRVIGGTRAALSFECPDAQAMVIKGQNQGQTVFQGEASKENDWLLMTHQLAPLKNESRMDAAIRRKKQQNKERRQKMKIAIAKAEQRKQEELQKEKEAKARADQRREEARQMGEWKIEKVMEKAEQGDPGAQYELGVRYYKNEDYFIDEDSEGNKDNVIAFGWFEKAAKQGDAYASIRVGYMYREGIGVAQNYDKAYEWFGKAVEQAKSLEDQEAYRKANTMLTFSEEEHRAWKGGIKASRRERKLREAKSIIVADIDIKGLHNDVYIHDMYKGYFPIHPAKVLDESFLATYIEFYNSNCSEYLSVSRKSFSHHRNIYVRSEYDFFKTTDYYKRIVSSTVWMDSRYYSAYSNYYSNLFFKIVAEIREEMYETDFAGFLSHITKRDTELAEDLSFIKSKDGCESPLLEKFSENLNLYVSGR